MSDRHFKNLTTTKRDWRFEKLQKYRNYSCQLRAYNNFGIGNWSGRLVISTDEDGKYSQVTKAYCKSLYECKIELKNSFFFEMVQ